MIIEAVIDGLNCVREQAILQKMAILAELT